MSAGSGNAAVSKNDFIRGSVLISRLTAWL